MIDIKKILALLCVLSFLFTFLFSCAFRPTGGPSTETPGSEGGNPPTDPPGGTEGDVPAEGLYVGMKTSDFKKQLPEDSVVFSSGTHWCFINEKGEWVIVRTSLVPSDAGDTPDIVEEIVVCDPPQLQQRSDLEDHLQEGMSLVQLIKLVGIPTIENVNGEVYFVFPLADEKRLITYCGLMGDPVYSGLYEFWYEYPVPGNKPTLTRPR